MKSTGKIQDIEAITELKSGTRQDKKSGKQVPWTLWGQKFLIDGETISATGFSKTDMQEKFGNLKVGHIIEFETEKQGDFVNFKKDAAVTIVGGIEEAANTPQPKKETPTPQPQEEFKMPTTEESAEAAIVVADKLTEGLKITGQDLLHARMKAYEQERLDVRTDRIQTHKQSNMAAMRGR